MHRFDGYQLRGHFIIDQHCEPITLKVDGHDANNIFDLTVSKNMTLEAKCLEGDIYYRLYKNDELVLERQGNVVSINQEDEYTRAEFYAYDSYGHKTEKSIDLKYPVLLDMPISKTPETKEPSNIGGVLIAIIVMSYVFYRKNKFRQNKNDLFTEPTVLLQDSTNTTVLCTSEDSK